jgi:hypothetical protein
MKKRLLHIRLMVLFFMVALALSGITAFPVETELRWLLQFNDVLPARLYAFLNKVYIGIAETNLKFPFLAYGYDWLAFAHLVIALLFVGVLKNPVQNIWVIEWAMIACVAIFPLAFIAGPIRQMPLYWQLIDCSFGVFGLLPLYICRKWIVELKQMQQ